MRAPQCLHSLRERPQPLNVRAATAAATAAEAAICPLPHPYCVHPHLRCQRQQQGLCWWPGWARPPPAVHHPWAQPWGVQPPAWGWAPAQRQRQGAEAGWQPRTERGLLWGAAACALHTRTHTCTRAGRMGPWVLGVLLEECRVAAVMGWPDQSARPREGTRLLFGAWYRPVMDSSMYASSQSRVHVQGSKSGGLCAGCGCCRQMLGGLLSCPAAMSSCGQLKSLSSP